MAVFYELQNVRGLGDALNKLQLSIQVQSERINRETAFSIRRRAKDNAPRDRGDLIANIEAQRRGKITWLVGILDVSIPSRGGNNSAHQNPWVYGRFLEFGFKGFRHPFMLPAVEAEISAWEARQAALAQAIERAA